jgi:hypothetical protein
MKVSVPLRTGRGLNDRYAHPMQRARVVKKEREAAQWVLSGQPAPAGPVRVLLCRVSPSSRGLDQDNLLGSLKAVRDQVASWLDRDNAHESITWQYAQRAGKPAEWAVEIEVTQ